MTNKLERERRRERDRTEEVNITVPAECKSKAVGQRSLTDCIALRTLCGGRWQLSAGAGELELDQGLDGVKRVAP